MIASYHCRSDKFTHMQPPGRIALSVLLVLTLGYLAGCDFSYKSIFDAAKEGDAEQVRKILDKDPSLVNARYKNSLYREQTALHLASTAEVVEILIAAGAELEARETVGLTPLHTAANAEVAQALIDAGAEVMAENSKGLTPLHLAENAAVAEVLIANGADVDYVKVPEWRDRSVNKKPLKDTPLYWAILNGKPDVVQVLLEYGANYNQPLSHNRTLLHHAAQYGNRAETIDILLEYFSDIDHRDEYGATPLHIAVINDKLAATEQLILAGADLNARINKGVKVFEIAGPGQFYAGGATPLIVAQSEEMRDLLKSYGATE